MKNYLLNCIYFLFNVITSSKFFGKKKKLYQFKKLNTNSSSLLWASFSYTLNWKKSILFWINEKLNTELVSRIKAKVNVIISTSFYPIFFIIKQTLSLFFQCYYLNCFFFILIRKKNSIRCRMKNPVNYFKD